MPGPKREARAHDMSGVQIEGAKAGTVLYRTHGGRIQYQFTSPDGLACGAEGICWLRACSTGSGGENSWQQARQVS